MRNRKIFVFHRIGFSLAARVSGSLLSFYYYSHIRYDYNIFTFYNYTHFGVVRDHSDDGSCSGTLHSAEIEAGKSWLVWWTWRTILGLAEFVERESRSLIVCTNLDFAHGERLG